MASNGAPPPDVDELRAGDDSPGRSLPPWVWRVASGAAVLALIGLVGADLHSRSAAGHPAAAAAPSPTVSRDAGPPVPSAPVVPLTWAPRGPDAGSAFAQDATTRARSQRPDVDRLLWAGTVDGHDRVALFSLRPSRDRSIVDGVQVSALRQAPGAPLSAAELQPMGSVRGPDGRVGAAWVGADGHTRLLVLGRPGPMSVDVSGVINYRPDGSIGRHWRQVSAPDGAGVVDLGRRADPVLVVRPFRKTPGANFLVSVGGGSPSSTPATIAVAGTTAPGYAGPDPADLRQDVADAMRALVDVRRASARVIWSGEIALGGDAMGYGRTSGRGALVRVQRADGPVFQAFVFRDEHGTLNSFTAYAVPWGAGDRLPYVFSTYDDGAPLLLLNPSRAGSVTISVPGERPETVGTGAEGVAILDQDASRSLGFGGAPVVVRDARGRVVLRSRMVDVSAVDPYGLYL